MESVGFKEWALVCEALGRGEQTIILRKGGIAEGREGFSFKHRQFFLFPTFFHEQVEKVRAEARRLPAQPKGEIEIRFHARVELTATITSVDAALSLERYHILQPDVVRERFEYDAAPGIHVAFVRVFRLPAPWRFRDAPRYGGCRSWVELPQPPELRDAQPVLSDDENVARVEQFRAALGQQAPAGV